jgi:ribosomal protein S12 methylthiotransferase accessory factor
MGATTIDCRALFPPGVSELFDFIRLPTDTGGLVHLALAVPGASLLRIPGYPAAALPQTGRVASGRGLCLEECYISCIGEAIELASCCQWGDEPLISATTAQMGPSALGPGALNGFTPTQLENREQWNKDYAGFDWRPAQPDPAVPVDWITVENAYGGHSAFAPADITFIGRRNVGDRNAVAIGDSNGCAAGPDDEAAKLNAVLELIERDATGRWWYGDRIRAPVDPESLELPDAVSTWVKDRSRRTWFFDISSDIEVPVMAAVSAEADGRDVALGFAARPDVRFASVVAFTELVQMEFSLKASTTLEVQASLWSRWRHEINMSTKPLDSALSLPLSTVKLPAKAGPHSDLSSVVSACEKRQVDLWLTNMTRAIFRVPVFRALSSALCHYKPRFQRQRLLAPDNRDLGRRGGRPETQSIMMI